MKNIWQKIEAKKKIYDNLKPYPLDLKNQIDKWLRVELTYSSNAIEGNTLSRLETAEVIARGVKALIPSKSLRDQLEAFNHNKALDYVDGLIKLRAGHQFIREEDIKKIHQIFLGKIDDNNAGIYRQVDVFIRGADVEFPAPQEVPGEMKRFTAWLESQQGEYPVKIAANAHFKFVSIHPFIDGNGRTARLLTNLILNLNGYPSAVIRPEDRIEYLQSIYEGQKKRNMDGFYKVIGEAVLRSLEMWISSKPFHQVQSSKFKVQNQKENNKLLKIGELAKISGETVHTLRFWIKEGILKPKETTVSGYQLFDGAAVKKAAKIRELQKEKRLRIKEIKKLI